MGNEKDKAEKVGIKFDKFLKVYGASGVKFFPLNEDLPAATGNEAVYNVDEVSGYGAFSKGRWIVFETVAELKRALV